MLAVSGEYHIPLLMRIPEYEGGKEIRAKSRTSPTQTSHPVPQEPIPDSSC
jgi:hypothetical protein